MAEIWNGTDWVPFGDEAFDGQWRDLLDGRDVEAWDAATSTWYPLVEPPSPEPQNFVASLDFATCPGPGLDVVLSWNAPAPGLGTLQWSSVGFSGPWTTLTSTLDMALETYRHSNADGFGLYDDAFYRLRYNPDNPWVQASTGLLCPL